MLGKLKKMLSSGDAYRESDSEYDGVLSYAAEWHALQHGLYDGMKSVRMRPKELPDDSDIQLEPHYYKSGYVVGTVLQLLVLVVVAQFGFVIDSPF